MTQPVKLKVALIGAGRAGEFHVTSLRNHIYYELRYLVDTHTEKALNLAQQYGKPCQAITDLYQVWLDPEIDAVIIATSTQTHYELTQLALKFRKNVLCEKPLPKARECFDLAQKMKKRLLVGYHKRFDSDYLSLIKEVNLSQGKIKRIHSIIKDNICPPSEYLRTSQGIAHDMLTHDIDIINILMKNQMPTKVVSFYHTEDPELKKINEIEEIEVMLEYPEGTIVNLSSSRKAGYGYDHRMEVCGDFGLFKLQNPQYNNLQYIHANYINESPILDNFTTRYRKAYLDELDYFYQMICYQHLNVITPDSIEINEKICDMIDKSIRENKIIYVEEKKLRTYENNTPQYNFYQEQHQTQSLEYVEAKIEKYSYLGRMKMKMKRALEMMDDFVDPSDPDVDLPNSVHAYQTAERIRKQRPLDEGLQITGLIHDLGKVLFKFGESPHTVVGDTFVVGCEFPESIVYYDTLKKNPDFYNPTLNNRLGIYQEKCGLKNLKISYGHDEYLYQVLQQNPNHKLDEKYQGIIRYHSLYPWHTGGAYRQFMIPSDFKLLKSVLDFNQFDLYSKEDIDFVLTDEIKEYYERLLDKFFPEELSW